MVVTTVKNLIEQLQQFPEYYEVTITDGYECERYRGAYHVAVYEDENGEKSVDIGIGGLKQ